MKHLRTSLLSALLVGVFATGTALAASSYTVSGSAMHVSEQLAIDSISQELISYCQSRGDRAGPVTITAVEKDPQYFVFFAEGSITCYHG